jgi:protein SCO1
MDMLLKMNKVMRLMLYIVAMVIGIILVTLNQVRADEDRTSFYTHFQRGQFVDQDGQALKMTSFKGKVVLFNFIYTQCSSVCPIQTKQLAEIQKSFSAELKRKVQFVSVSLDPLNDTPKKLKTYAENMHIDLSHWSFITGRPDDIKRISDQLSLYGNPAANQNKAIVQPNDHSTHLWAINKDGQLMMQYSGVPIDKVRISNEMKQLVMM